MIKNITKSLALAAFSFAFITVVHAQQIFKASDVFRKWLDCQEVYQDRDIAHQTQALDENFLSAFKNNYEASFTQLKSLKHFLMGVTNGQINQDGYQLRAPLDETMKLRIGLLQSLIETDLDSLIECFKLNGLSSLSVNTEEVRTPAAEIIEKYKALARLIFSHPNKITEDETLFVAADKLFEHCFEQSTALQYQSLLTNQENHPIARFLNAVMWYHLVGDGWKHWNKSCLELLKQEASDGKEIVYIAGGSDLYTLLKNKMYSIRVIDPYLPTQLKFYSEGWELLVHGLVGDEIRFNHDADHITLRRKEQKQDGYFQAKLANGTIQELPKTTTVWTVVNKQEQQLGSITIERRFAMSSDLTSNCQSNILLMSYNELVYAASVDSLNGCSFDLAKLNESDKVFVKQLRKPVTKIELSNLRTAGTLNTTHLKFINFASEVS